MEFVLWRPGRMMASFLAVPSASFVTRYPESRMGRKFSGSVCMFLKTNHLFSSKSILMSSMKRLWDREKYGSCFPIGRGMCVCRLRLEMELADAPDMAGGVLVSIRIWSSSEKKCIYYIQIPGRPVQGSHIVAVQNFLVPPRVKVLDQNKIYQS